MIPVKGKKPENVWFVNLSDAEIESEPEEKPVNASWRDRVREIVTPIWFDYDGTHFFDGDGNGLENPASNAGRSMHDGYGENDKRGDLTIAAG